MIKKKPACSNPRYGIRTLSTVASFLNQNTTYLYVESVTFSSDEDYEFMTVEHSDKPIALGSKCQVKLIYKAINMHDDVNRYYEVFRCED